MFKQDQLKQSKNTSENLGKGLIFIIGMPRSGTTLVESILASSEDSFAGGEKVFFHVQCSPLIKQFHNNKELENDVLSDLGKQYLEIIDIQRKGKRIFIDKMPDNYLYYRFIKFIKFGLCNISPHWIIRVCDIDNFCIIINTFRNFF